jgi:TonB family protein
LFGIGFALLASAQSTVVSAQPGQPWEVRRVEERCLLLRRAEAPSGAIFFIERMPGTDATSVNFTNPAWKKAPGTVKELQLTLEPGGAEQVISHFRPARGFPPQLGLDRSRLSLAINDRGFLGRLASATSLSVRQGPREVARSSLPMPRQAVEALRGCERDALKSWGIDPGRWEVLRSGPSPKVPLAALVGDGDYPSKASDARAAGKAIVRLEIDLSGKVTRCDAVVSSGHEILDRQTCAIALRRARFEPAQDANGRAVAAPYVTSITWHMYP